MVSKRRHSKKKSGSLLLPVVALAVLVVGGFMVFGGSDLSSSLTGRFLWSNFSQNSVTNFVVYNCSQDDDLGPLPEANVPGSTKVYSTDISRPTYYADNCAYSSTLNEYSCDPNGKLLRSYSLTCYHGCLTDSTGRGYCR